MFPIALDLTRIPILLVGSGELLSRRRVQLEAYGAAQLIVRNDSEYHADEIQGVSIVMIAGLPRARAEAIVADAQAAGKLINVEDIPQLCDFYFTANVRRGELVIAVSTSGASPTLARKIRDAIAARFGEEWAERVREMSQLRLRWKSSGASMREVLDKTEKYVEEKAWFSSFPPPGGGNKKSEAA